MGTSSQMPVSTDQYKRTTSLLNPDAETVVDISDKWKKKHTVKGSSSFNNTHERIYVPASNIERSPEDGCMKKILFERSLKLRKEDTRDKDYCIIRNGQAEE